MPHELLRDDRFPRSNRYNPSWITESPMGAHPLWLTEWLCGQIALEPGMSVLDLGCGKAKSSIFMAREYGVQVWAADLWTTASENYRRIRDAELADRVFPIHTDARELPFAGEFFDAAIGIDSFNYFATDDLYLNYLAHFVRPGGVVAFVSAGLMQELGPAVPEHLQRFWTQDCWTIHTASWWQHHLARTGLVEVTSAGTIPDGWRLWLDWAEATGTSDWYREMLATDGGCHLGYVGVIATRTAVPVVSYAWPSTLRSMPDGYEPHPLVRPTSPG